MKQWIPPWQRSRLGGPRRLDDRKAFAGEVTDPYPTDRGKLGTRRHILTDGRGIPLAVTLTGANVDDRWMVGATLDAIPIWRMLKPMPPKRNRPV